jgi:hypothetical protein
MCVIYSSQKKNMCHLLFYFVYKAPRYETVWGEPLQKRTWCIYTHTSSSCGEPITVYHPHILYSVGLNSLHRTPFHLFSEFYDLYLDLHNKNSETSCYACPIHHVAFVDLHMFYSLLTISLLVKKNIIGTLGQHAYLSNWREWYDLIIWSLF